MTYAQIYTFNYEDENIAGWSKNVFSFTVLQFTREHKNTEKELHFTFWFSHHKQQKKCEKTRFSLQHENKTILETKQFEGMMKISHLSSYFIRIYAVF